MNKKHLFGAIMLASILIVILTLFVLSAITCPVSFCGSPPLRVSQMIIAHANSTDQFVFSTKSSLNTPEIEIKKGKSEMLAVSVYNDGRFGTNNTVEVGLILESCYTEESEKITTITLVSPKQQIPFEKDAGYRVVMDVSTSLPRLYVCNIATQSGQKELRNNIFVKVKN